MNSGYSNQPPYPGVSFNALPPPAQAPETPAKPWPMAAANRLMTTTFIALTVLAVLLAVLAPSMVSGPSSTAGMTLAYQSSLTQNNSGSLYWDATDSCQFSSDGYIVTGTNPSLAMRCRLLGSSFQNFTLKVRVVAAFDTAVIGFLGDDRLEISGSGHFRLYRGEPILGIGTFLYPPTGLAVGSAALHNTSLGVSERANDITLQILGQSYSIYANGQLLGTYLANVQESAGPIWLGTNRGQQAEFRDIAIYTPS